MATYILQKIGGPTSLGGEVVRAVGVNRKNDVPYCTFRTVVNCAFYIGVTCGVKKTEKL